MNRSIARACSISVMTMAIGAIGASASSADSPVAPKVYSSPTPVIAYSIAVDGGGPITTSSGGIGDLLSDIGAVVRPAGGYGILGRTVQVIYSTARICPQCFIP